MTIKSESQWRFLFSTRAKGKPPRKAAGCWAAHAKNFKILPEYVKTAANLTDEALDDVRTGGMQNYVYGSTLRDYAETGQPKAVVTRTKGSIGHDRQMDRRYQHKNETARGGGATKHYKEASMSNGIMKSAAAAGFWHDPKKLDLAGLGVLGLAPAYHGIRAVKDLKSKDKTERSHAVGDIAAGATELGGLGLLARAVRKGH